MFGLGGFLLLSQKQKRSPWTIGRVTQPLLVSDFGVNSEAGITLKNCAIRGVFDLMYTQCQNFQKSVPPFWHDVHATKRTLVPNTAHIEHIACVPTY